MQQQGGSTHHEAPFPGSGAPGLSSKLQRRIVLGLGAATGLALGLVTLSTHLFGGQAETSKKPSVASDSFQPTAGQMAGLKTAPIALLSFRTELVTDGKIAVNGNTTTPVFSPFSGRVTKVIANSGDTVAKGAPLLAVEATEFIQAQNDLVAAIAALDTAHAQQTQAELIEKRKHALFEAKGASLQDWQQSQSDLIAAQGAARSAEIALAAVRNRLRVLGKTESEVAVIEASRKMDATALVVAPIEGTITDRQVGPGQYIQSGAGNPVFAISNLSSVWLVGNVRETDAPGIRRGMPVEVRVLAYPERVFKAKLTYVGPAVDPATRRVAVRAEVDNPDGALKPEMFASFSIVTGTESKAPAVPESAIVYEGQMKRIWIAKPDGSLALREIRTGRNAMGMFEVLAGAVADEKVVTSGTLFIDRAARQE